MARRVSRGVHDLHATGDIEDLSVSQRTTHGNRFKVAVLQSIENPAGGRAGVDRRGYADREEWMIINMRIGARDTTLAQQLGGSPSVIGMSVGKHDALDVISVSPEILESPKDLLRATLEAAVDEGHGSISLGNDEAVQEVADMRDAVDTRGEFHIRP